MTMIKLKLMGKETLEQISSWKEFKSVELDSGFGIVCISPQEKLYVVRATIEISKEIYHQLTESDNPRILGVFGDIRISTASESPSARQHKSDDSISGQPTNGDRGVNGDAAGRLDDVDSRD